MEDITKENKGFEKVYFLKTVRENRIKIGWQK